MGAAPAGAHGKDAADTSAKRQQFTDGVSVPVVTSPNIRFVTNVPDTAAISGVFARSAPYFYVSSTDSITVYDVSNPVQPRITGVLPNIVFENEAMNYGEKKVDGVTNRFVLVGVDLVEAAPSEPDHIGTSNEVMLVDVTDPTAPRIRSRVATTTNTHTVSCIRRDRLPVRLHGGAQRRLLDRRPRRPRPRRARSTPTRPWTACSPSARRPGPNPAFTSGAGHKWNFDDAGYGIHTGSGGSAIFDVSRPRPLRGWSATTDEHGVTGPWNDFIHHNSARPNASRYASGQAPSVANGNVLLVTEEDYENTDCATAGSIQTWQVGSLDGTPGTITPLDRINPVDIGEGVSAPQMAFCSAHWFDFHPSGIVAPGLLRGRPAAARRPRPDGHQGVRLRRQRALRGLGRLLGAGSGTRTASRPAGRPTSSTPSTRSAGWTSTPSTCPAPPPGGPRPAAARSSPGRPDPALGGARLGLAGLAGLATARRRFAGHGAARVLTARRVGGPSGR